MIALAALLLATLPAQALAYTKKKTVGGPGAGIIYGAMFGGGLVLFLTVWGAIRLQMWCKNRKLAKLAQPKDIEDKLVHDESKDSAPSRRSSGSSLHLDEAQLKSEPAQAQTPPMPTPMPLPVIATYDPDGVEIPLSSSPNYHR